MKKLTMKSLNRSIVGRWATVKFDDIGRMDGLIVEILDDGKIKKNTSINVFFGHSNGCSLITADQIIEVRDYVKAQ